jgi:hypothetical protein
MTRMTRINQSKRSKARALRNAKAMRVPGSALTPRFIGKAAAQHNTCPCWLCQYDKHGVDFDKYNPTAIFA